MKHFGVLSFFHGFALYYFCLHTFSAQPQNWYEIKKNWKLVAWRFPQFTSLNGTDAILRAETYYNETVVLIGFIGLLLLVLNSLMVWCSSRMFNSTVIEASMFPLSTIFMALVSLCLIAMTIYEGHRQEYYGLVAQVPLMISVNAVFWVAAAIFGAYIQRARLTETKPRRRWWCVYFWTLSFALIAGLGCIIACGVYMKHHLQKLDDAPEAEIRQATIEANLPLDSWGREDYKNVLIAHFAPIQALWYFLTTTLLLVFVVGGVHCRRSSSGSGWQRMPMKSTGQGINL